MWSIVWWLFLLILLAMFIAGWLVSFFVMRNNPKYFNVDKMIKEDLQKLADKVMIVLKERSL